MPVLRKTINLTVSGNTLLATDSVTSLSTSDAGVQGEDEAVLFHVVVPTDWQDLSVRLKVMSQDGGYDLSDLPVSNVISMPLRQGLTMASGRLTVSLIGSTTVGVRKSADCKTLTVVASAQEINPISHIYPYPVRHITGSGGALVTQTSNDTYNVNVTGTGGDMLQANYANGNVSNANTVDVSKTAKAAQSGSALETVIAAKMPTATYAAGTGHANTNKADHAIAADTADAAYAGSTLDTILKTGWIPLANTFTYASVTTVTVPTDLTGIFHQGVKLKFTQGGVVVYYLVDSAIYSSPNTTLTIRPFDASTLANSAISSVYYSVAFAPVGFPINPPYTTVSLGNSWANYSGSYESPGYLKDSLNWVEIKGMIANGTLSTTIFTLPVGYRPLITKGFSVYCFNGTAALAGLITINSSGAVSLLIGANANLVLEGIRFKAEQ
jgi:hypothetical protein